MYQAYSNNFQYQKTEQTKNTARIYVFEIVIAFFWIKISVKRNANINRKKKPQTNVITRYIAAEKKYLVPGKFYNTNIKEKSITSPVYGLAMLLFGTNGRYLSA